MTQSGPDPRYEDLLSLIERQARAFGDKTFMTFGDGESMSFSDFERRVAGFRSHLIELGVEPGERVALMLKNSLFYPVAWLGAASSGAMAVPVNSRLGETDARYVLEHSGAVALVVDDQTEQVARAAVPEAIRTVVSARAGDPMTEFQSMRVGARPDLHAGLLANIQYTSGTTGFPKGCLLTHRFWQRMGATAVEVMEITDVDTLLTSQPHSYIDPQWNVIAALRSGAHLVLLDGFHPSTFMYDVARFDVTVFYCLGVMPTLLLKQPPGSQDDNLVQRVFCSAIPVDQHEAIQQRWGAPWIEIFGMTETGVNTGVPVPDNYHFVGSGCIGKPFWHIEATVLDESDRELPAGQIGELAFKGLGFMNGYHNDPEATTEFFRNGWAHTGDLVERDDEGFLYYRGRRKEMIRRGGENIAPVEIESALATHPDVVECAVASVPDDDLGEEIKAYVVRRPDSRVEAAELADYLRKRLARFKVPRFWEFRASLPHTASERVAKPELERGREDHLIDTTDLKT